jgi:thiamine biosynthesis lipoprotein
MHVPVRHLCIAALGFGVVFLGGTVSAPADEPAVRRFEFAEPHMGVSFKLVLYAADETLANRAARAAFDRVAALDRMMSDYDSASELSRLSATAPASESVAVSPELWVVLERGQRLARETDGAFDVTVGSLTRLWRRARRQQEMPSKERLAEALVATGYKNLKLDRQRRAVQLLRGGMRLDLGGIAKGYAGDEALAVLKKHGVTRAMVAASGDIAVGDPPIGERGWRIAVGALDPKEKPSRFLRLANCGVSTSGDAFQFVVIDGRRYSHIVDPRTGLGLTQRASATVIAADAMSADGFATAVTVLGPKAGIEFAKKQRGVEALVVFAVGEMESRTETVQTEGFGKHVE